MSEREKRALYTDWEHEGRKWSIGKFDAMTGSYVAYKLMAEILPMGLGAKVGVPAQIQKKGMPTMSRADFQDLQRDCLGVCRELLKSGPAPVLADDGTFAVEGLEHDTKTVLALTIQALAWNVRDFFDESLLSSLASTLGMSSPAVPT